MQAKQIGIAFVIGCALIVLGLLPRTLCRFLYRFNEEMQNFRDSLFPFGARAPHQGEYVEQLSAQIWLVVWGMALVLVSLIAYFSN